MIAERARMEAELAKIEQAVAAQEGLHGILPDEQIEATLAALREKQAAMQAQLTGSGAIAQGEDAQAVGERGIGGKHFQGVAVTGDQNVVILASQAAGAFWREFAPRYLSEAGLRQATERYLAHVVDRYCYLDFKGMGVSDRVPLRLPLVEMYIPLKARIELPEGETWTRQLRLAGRQVNEDESEAIGQRLSEPTPVLDLLR